MSGQQRADAGRLGFRATAAVVTSGLGLGLSIGDPSVFSGNLGSIITDLHMSAGLAAFAASVTTLTLAAAILGAGSLGDIFGRKRLYMYGLVGAVVFGVLAVIAPNGGLLMAARAGTGICWALIMGLSLALVRATVPGDRLAKAYGMTYSSAFLLFACMPSVSGWLTDHTGWRGGEALAPVLAAVLIPPTLKFVQESPRAHRQVDYAGILLSAASLLGIIYGASKLSDGLTVVSGSSLAAGILLGLYFVRYELRHEEPALDLRLFRSGSFTAGMTAGMMFNLITSGMILLMTYFITQAKGMSSGTVGLVITAGPVGCMIFSPIAGRLAAAKGAKPVLTLGHLVLAVGLVTFALADRGSSVVQVAVAWFAVNVGVAFLQVTQTTMVMRDSRPEQGGAVSGAKAMLDEAIYSLGAPMVTLIIGLVFGKVMAPHLRGTTTGRTRDALTGNGHVAHDVLSAGRHAMAQGISVSLWVMVAVCLVSLTICWRLLGTRGTSGATRSADRTSMSRTADPSADSEAAV